MYKYNTPIEKKAASSPAMNGRCSSGIKQSLPLTWGTTDQPKTDPEWDRDLSAQRDYRGRFLDFYPETEQSGQKASIIASKRQEKRKAW